jgi:competence protein ComEC
MIAGLAAYVVGCGLRLLFASWLALSIIIALLGVGLTAGLRAGFPRVASTLVTCLIVTGVVGGLGRPGPLPSSHLLYHLPSGSANLEGWVAEEPLPSRKTLTTLVASEWLYTNGSRRPVEGYCLLRLPPESPVAYGQRIRLTGLLLYRPKGYANPGGFDFREFLARREVYVVGRLSRNGALLSSSEVHPRASLIWGIVSRLRTQMLWTIEKTLPSERGGVLQAIVLGARERLSREVRDHFRNTGTAHLLAISGLHVGFIAVAAFWALKTLVRAFLRLVPEPWGVRLAPSRWAALGTAPAVLFYALLVGGRVATVRATIMILVYLASRICREPRNHFHALSLAALLILIWDPASVGDIGFQLSFVAVTAILLGLRSLDRKDRSPLPPEEQTWAGRIKRRVLIYLFVSMVAFLATWPLIARTFHRVALISPLANALVFPLASLTIPLGLAAALSGLVIPAAAGAFLTPAGWGAALLLATLKVLARLSFSNITVRAPSLNVVLVYYTVFASLLLWPRCKRRGLLALAAAALALGATGTAALESHYSGKQLTVTALDAGRAQSVLISLPDGRRLLWFAAPPRGDPSVVRQVVVPALLQQRVGHLDGLIGGNDTEETAKGILSLAQSVEVKELWVAQMGDVGGPASLRNALEQLALPVKTIKAGWSEPCGKTCTIRALWPKPGTPALRGAKVSGPVLLFKYNQKKALLTGDSSYHVEKALLAGREDVGATLLQVPKAGSRFASSGPFLKRVAPEVAVLAARPPWSWREDVAETLDRYRRRGIAVWRVDQDGAVTWRTDGKSSSVASVRVSEGASLRPRPKMALARGRSR